MSLVEIIKNKFSDQSLLMLLFANVLTIIFAIINQWDVWLIMVVYWFQSVIIGVLHFLRMLLVKQEGGDNVAQTISRYFSSFFFLIHYGIFHLVYLFFLIFAVVGGETRNIDNTTYLFAGISILVFAVNHFISFLKKMKTNFQNPGYVGKLIFLPYARIIPMHLTIILGAFLPGAIYYFLVLKTIADLIMHSVDK